MSRRAGSGPAISDNRRFLKLDAVTKRFGGADALSACTLAITRGEFVTLLGPSGCGKTTTLRLIAGFLYPDSGEVRLDGQLLSSSTVRIPPEKRNIGMVFQSFAVWPHMRVIDNIALPLRIRGWRRADVDARCAEMLKLCRLEGLENRDPHQLSGGQLQRVALARALAYRPQLLLLDEPLSNLDAALRDEVRRELKGIHRAIGTTFIFVTHDQVEAMSLSDRVVVMNCGRIEQIGPPREIYQGPTSDFVAQFVGAANILKGEVESAADAEDPMRCRVKVGGLELIARPTSPLAAGTACTVVVHPETIRIEPLGEGANGDSGFVGRIREVVFLGRLQEVVVEAGGVDLRAVQVRGSRVSPRDRVRVLISPADVLLL